MKKQQQLSSSTKALSKFENYKLSTAKTQQLKGGNGDEGDLLNGFITEDDVDL